MKTLVKTGKRGADGLKIRAQQWRKKPGQKE